jgi:WD40 repeat protein
MDSTVRLWELETGKEINRHTDHTELVKCAAYSPDGQSVLSGGGSTYDLATDTFTRGKDCDLRLWAADSLKEIRRFKGHEDTVWGIVFTPDGKQALSTANDQTIRLWDIASGKEVKRLSDRKNRFSCLALSPEGKQVLAGGGGYQSAALQLWNIEAGKSIRTFQGHKDWVRSVAVSPDGKRGLSGSMDGTVRLWDLETGKQLRSLKHASGIQGVAFSPDGLFAISGSGSQWRATRTRTEPSPGDWLLHVWDLETGKEMAQLAGHRWGLMDVKVCQDGHRVLSAGMDGTIRLWGLPELKPAKKK